MEGPTFAPVAYLSKQLDPTVQGWAPCLRALAAAYVLLRESKKLTFRASITITSPYHLRELLTYKGLQTLLPCHVLSLLVSFINDPSISFETCSSLNPASLIPVTTKPPTYPCIEVLESLLPCPIHIKEGSLDNPTHIWFTDGSSFKMDGQRHAGYAIVSLTDVIEARPLPPNTTNQQAELVIVTRAFELASDSTLTIYRL